ncbi:FAD binding domain-containing protein [Streptomyces oryzae]|uniref:FAD binding domain-containing protein n=1 Tax=Streptomyces oryzae TaxID=1434886 RepID=A0ABS3XL50_9ACTN|nr:FAD binding domain-containing protein [Streptomyces oryzae]MBO8196143.1 FAD binding domain-containing protein [Streptomyces oryzae]
MKPAPFRYHRARDVEDATALLAELGDEAKVIAGGQSLVAMMNFRLARPAHLVDIGGLRELDHLGTDAGGGLRIGALTTHHTVETAPPQQLGAGFDIIRAAMAWIGHLPIRTRGTAGGSMAHGDATAEWCLLAVLLDAELVARSPRGQRRVPAREFFFGYYTTALDPDEILVEIVFPHPAPHAALTEFAERRGDFAVVSAAVSLEAEGRAVHGGRVALGGVAAMPVRVPEAEAVLAAGGSFRDCAEAAAAAVDPPGDANGSPHYRKHLIRTLVERACEEAMSR